MLLRRRDFPFTIEAFLKDVIAGITVAIVALPLAIGFGITSGMSAASGISTAIIAGFIAALFGGSRFQVSGPTGAMTVVLVPVIQKHGATSIPFLGLAAGLLLLVMAFLRIGRLIEKVPEAVLEGFTVAIAIIIALQQLPYALGVEKGTGDRTIPIAISTVKKALDTNIHWATLAILVLTLLVKFNIVKIVEALRIRFYIPASFSALLVSTTVVELFHIHVGRIGEIPKVVSTYTPPTFENIPSLIYPACAIAFLAAIESLLAARVADELARVAKEESFQPNRELFGQGLATLTASLFGGMPATGAIARTNVNVRSNAQSRLSAMTHSLTLLLIILFAAPLFGHIPTAAIAGVLIGTSFRIFNKATMKEILSSNKTNITIYLTTALATVALDLMWGIAIGVLIYFILKK